MVVDVMILLVSGLLSPTWRDLGGNRDFVFVFEY